MSINFMEKLFSERLKLLRTAKGISQKQLGIITNTSARTIQSYELGDRLPGYECLIAIADAFDISLDYLVGRSDDPTRH